MFLKIFWIEQELDGIVLTHSIISFAFQYRHMSKINDRTFTNERSPFSHSFKVVWSKQVNYKIWESTKVIGWDKRSFFSRWYVLILIEMRLIWVWKFFQSIFQRIIPFGIVFLFKLKITNLTNMFCSVQRIRTDREEKTWLDSHRKFLFEYYMHWTIV